ncbi:hypothetical protein [Geobacillus thermodenitrificans]|uniref:Transposase n=1 Tax=Geobacillus thermodenitrificans TaxID=33940 RepID=A0ABY9QEZ0_GEOTD|nr:hypothetical protein [Geobacillus thermodenitrificans]WMV77468.1 hypothetical protein HSX42_06825 [Geobacillus thermodenitrificans]
MSTLRRGMTEERTAHLIDLSIGLKRRCSVSQQLVQSFRKNGEW